MNVTRLVRESVVALATLGVVTTPWAHGGTPASAPAPAAVRDVALSTDGMLRGQVLDPQGAPRVGMPVAVAQQGKVVARSQTVDEGRFAIEGMKAGVYQLATPNGGGVIRLWQPRTAPPAAQPEALVVDGQTVIRGVGPGGGVIGFLANPWVLGGITAAAIAVPLSIDDDDDQPPSS